MGPNLEANDSLEAVGQCYLISLSLSAQSSFEDVASTILPETRAKDERSQDIALSLA